MKYQDHFSTRRTPQSQPIPGTAQVANNADGFAWQVDDWKRLDRFLILGSEGGTYYVGEHELTIQNAQAVLRCVKSDGPPAVARIAEISEAGRAAKNDPALFALAIAAGEGDVETRKAALEALPRVARTGTHLFHFLEYAQAFRGWGKAMRMAVAHWYGDMPADRLAYQAVKYRQRDGWTHRDALRLAHPRPDDERGPIYAWLAGKAEGKTHPLIDAFERMQTAENERQIITVLNDSPGLPWETVPTQFLKSPEVWQALLPRLPLTATLRNLGRMTANGLLAPMSEAANTVSVRLTNQESLKAARVHPIQVLSALRTYQRGHGERGSLSWQPVREVVDALDAAFYLSFGNVQPTGKRLVFGLDVSGSMAGTNVNGVPSLSAREACGAMALVTANVERQYAMVAFDTRPYELSISPRQRLDDVVNLLARTGGGGTDCAAPIEWAMQNGTKADALVILTDSETWYGRMHPAQTVTEYRRRTGVPAKMVTVAMASNHVTIGDVEDAGMLDVVGFDLATPNLISDFIR